MSQQRAQDRLQPALLDRLTDENPDSLVESPDQRFINKSRMREAVLRDLSWLFNTTQPLSKDDLLGFAGVSTTVLAFGLPPLSGQTLSSIEARSLEQHVTKAILNFEPRILPTTLQVEAIVVGLQVNHHNQISFRISGQVWAQPVPLELLLQTNVNLETGQVEIRDMTR
jgi:type VI secretion system protein ImpF